MRYLFFVLFTTGFALQAQTSIGFLSGYNRSHERYADDVAIPEDGRTHIHAWHASAVGETRLSRRLRLGAELGLVQRGAACIPGFLIFNQDTELRLNYVQFAPSLVTRVASYRRFGLYAYSGGSISYLLSGTRTITDGFSGREVKDRLILDHPTSNMRRLDYGLAVGAMLRYALSGGSLTTRIGTYRGFRHVDRENFSLSRDLLLSVGYLHTL